MKKRLLHVTSSLKMGGAEAVLCDLIRGLGNDEFEHHVIYFHAGPWVKELRALGVPLYHIRGLVSLYDPVFFWRLFRTVKMIRPDCVHSLLWAANVSSRVIARLLSIPHVCVYHNNIDQDGRLRNLLDGMTRRLSTRLVAVSKGVAQSLAQADACLSVKNILVIRNGIDMQRVRHKSSAQVVARNTLGFDESHFIVGSVGRFCPVKNYPLLLESFALLTSQRPEARLLLLGTGPEEQRLRDLAQKLGIAGSARFVVGQPARGYFPLFDCFVQSSDKEGISMALLEAMSHAVPCVVTNVGPVHSVLTHQKDGLIVKAGDASDLAHAMGSFVQDREWATRLGQEGQKTVESSFDFTSMVGAYRDLFLAV